MPTMQTVLLSRTVLVISLLGCWCCSSQPEHKVKTADQLRQEQQAKLREEQERLAYSARVGAAYNPIRKVGTRWCILPSSMLPLDPQQEQLALHSAPPPRSQCYASLEKAEKARNDQSLAAEKAAQEAARPAAERRQRYDLCMEGMRLAYGLGKVNAYDAYHSCDQYR